MLQKIRDGSSGPLAYVVVGLIAVVFGVWGIGSYFTPSSDPVVATAGDTDIHQSQLQQGFNQRYQQLRQMMGDRFDSGLFPPGEIRRQVLNGLIDQAVTTAYAQDAGYRVSDADLLSVIRSNPQFQEDGKFSAERYKQLLAGAGIQPAQYEARLRQSLVGGQLQRVVASGAFAVPPEVQAAFERSHAERRIEVLEIDPAAYRDRVKVDQAAVRDYYAAHKQQFMRPARVKLAYVSLDANSLNSAPADEQTLRTLFDQRRGQFGQPEKRSAEMVRIPIGDDNDTKARQAVQSLVSSLKSDGNTSLQAAAKNIDGAQYQSVDHQPQSALPDAVGEALFGLKQGAVSNPVRGDDAWYLVRATAVTPAVEPDFNDPKVQQRLQAMAHERAMAKNFRKASDRLGNLAYQAPNDLKTLSKELDLPIQTTGWITKNGGDGLGQYDSVRKAAFSDAVYNDKLNSRVLDLGAQRKIVLRIADRQPAAARPIAQVAGPIRQQLIADKAGKLAQQAGEQAMSRAKQGTPLAKLVGQTPGATLRSPGYVSQDDSQLAPAIMDAAFAVPVDGQTPNAKRPAGYRLAQTNNGSAAVVAVMDQRIGAPGKKSAADAARQQLVQQQRRYNASLEYAAFDNYLRNRADINIEKDSLTTNPADGT